MLGTSVVDLHRFYADPDPDRNFHVYADPVPDPDWYPNGADPPGDPTPSFKLVGKIHPCLPAIPG